MKSQQSIYRISYSVYDEAIRPLPQFYFYAWASNEHESLEKFNNFAEEQSISCRCVAAGYTLEEEDLPAAVDRDSLEAGIAIERKVSQPAMDKPLRETPSLEPPTPATPATAA